MRAAIAEHQRVLSGITAHDSVLAEAAMREHITSFQARIRDLL